MTEKKDTMVKDAIILCLITLVLGAVLAGVYTITKAPIEQAQAKANNEACAAVVASGDKVQDADKASATSATAYFAKHDENNGDTTDEAKSLAKIVTIQEVHPTQNGGYVFLATAKKGYGGDIDFALGVDQTGAITGISITSESETAGLGANCENKDWLKTFTGKVAPSDPSKNMYYKASAEDESSQIQALSGATVTTRAITKAIKGLMFFQASLTGGAN